MPGTETAEEKVAAESSRRSDAQLLCIVAACGGVGGLVYLVTQRMAGLSPISLKLYFAVPALAVVGAVAALIGVFVVANTDTRDIRRTIAFALICGLAWEPVLKSATNLVTSTIEAQKGESVVSTSEALNAALRSRGHPQKEQQVENKTTDTANRTAQLIEVLPAVQDNAVRRKLLRDSNVAVTSLAEASTVNPEASIRGLTLVGKMATEHNQSEVSSAVLNQLQQIRMKRPELAPRIEAAVNEINEGRPVR